MSERFPTVDNRRCLDEAFRRGIVAERKEPRCYLGEKSDVVVRFRCLLERNADEGGQASRETRRKQRVGLDDAGVAVGRALPRLAAVDQRDGKAALGEVQGDRDADDTGAEHDRVGASHVIFPVKSAGSRRGWERNEGDIGEIAGSATFDLGIRTVVFEPWYLRRSGNA